MCCPYIVNKLGQSWVESAQFTGDQCTSDTSFCPQFMSLDCPNSYWGKIALKNFFPAHRPTLEMRVQAAFCGRGCRGATHGVLLQCFCRKPPPYNVSNVSDQMGILRYKILKKNHPPDFYYIEWLLHFLVICWIPKHVN